MSAAAAAHLLLWASSEAFCTFQAVGPNFKSSSRFINLHRTTCKSCAADQN